MLINTKTELQAGASFTLRDTDFMSYGREATKQKEVAPNRLAPPTPLSADIGVMAFTNIPESLRPSPNAQKRAHALGCCQTCSCGPDNARKKAQMGKNILSFLRPPAEEPTPLLKMNELCHLFGCSRMTIYRWIEQHKLPSPIRHKNKTKRLIGWDRREIEVMLRHR